MKTYYIVLPKLGGIFMTDVSHTHWHINDNERKQLKATTLWEAKHEGSKIFNSNRELEFSYLDHRFSQDQKINLKSSFPKDMSIIEEIRHEISV